MHAQDSAAYTKRGIELAKAKQYDKAAEEFGMAMKADPNDPKHYLNRGSAYKAAGKFAEAEKDFSQLIEMEPKTTTMATASGEKPGSEKKLRRRDRGFIESDRD